jgi:hypothetical protein
MCSYPLVQGKDSVCAIVPRRQHNLYVTLNPIMKHALKCVCGRYRDMSKQFEWQFVNLWTNEMLVFNVTELMKS